MKDHGIYDEEGMSPKQQQRNKHENTSLAAIPIHRVFEMRGTLFYEINGKLLFSLHFIHCTYCYYVVNIVAIAHKLALMDLGKAIAINPSNPGNYFLRGDCHSKLGNYEQVQQQDHPIVSITISLLQSSPPVLLCRHSMTIIMQRVKDLKICVPYCYQEDL